MLNICVAFDEDWSDMSARFYVLSLMVFLLAGSADDERSSHSSGEGLVFVVLLNLLPFDSCHYAVFCERDDDL